MFWSLCQCLLHKVTWDSCSPLVWHSGPWKGIMCSCWGWFIPGPSKHTTKDLCSPPTYCMPKMDHWRGSTPRVTDSSQTSISAIVESSPSRQALLWSYSTHCIRAKQHFRQKWGKCSALQLSMTITWASKNLLMCNRLTAAVFTPPWAHILWVKPVTLGLGRVIDCPVRW